MIALMIDDTLPLLMMTAESLRAAGWQVDCESNSEGGLWRARQGHYDVIILDIVLPDGSGLELLETLRNEGIETPVILLTARDAVDDRVRGLNKGADDYLVKPFEAAELIARCNALNRRHYHQASAAIEVGSLRIDCAARCVYRNGEELALPPREYALLEFLAHRRGEVVSRTEIERHIYDDEAELSSNAVDARIYALRKAIDVSGEPSLIVTRRGAGYALRG